MSLERWHAWWRKRRADCCALALFVGFFLLFFSWLGWEHKLSVGSDAFAYSLPLRTITWRMIRQGALPLWTPYVMSGYPLLAMTQTAVGYPLTWGYLLLPGPWAEEIYLLAPFLLAPAFNYSFARELGRSRTAAVLAGLLFSYTGWMIGVFGLYGYDSNAVVWLPLMLTAIERARRPRSFAPCLLWTTGAFAMSVLNGQPQFMLYAGAIAVSYALFGSIFGARGSAEGAIRPHWLSWSRWRPTVVALSAVALAAGLGAFELFETMRAVRRSARVKLTQELFLGNSPILLRYELGSFLAPLYYWELPTYVPPLALLLGALAVVHGLRRRQRDVRIFYLVALACMSWLLMLGVKTPLYDLFGKLGVLKFFQVPMRHSIEWTFALSLLAAYGWDALRAWNARRESAPAPAQQGLRLILTLVLLLSAAAAGILWWRATNYVTGGTDYPALIDLLKTPYLAWKAAFTLLTLTALWLARGVVAVRWRTVLTAGVIALVCFVEPYITVWHWWRPFAKPLARYAAVSQATGFLVQLAPEQNRVYTRVNLFVEEFTQQPALDPPNLTALYGLHNAGGYEPLILDRYSRALGDVLSDTVSPRYGARPNLELFEPHSHVLDLLNTTHVVSYAGLTTAPQHLFTREEIKFNDDLNVELPPGATFTLSGSSAVSDTLALVTTLANSTNVADGWQVARLRLFTTDKRAIELSLRAGLDTAEWAHERPDVRQSIKHHLAPIFDSRAGDAAGSFQALRYWARLPLGESAQVDRVEITNATDDATLYISAGALFDSTQHSSAPLLPVDPEGWRTVYSRDDVLILRNMHACPRAWLVSEAEAVDGEEALRRIRGAGPHEFDPRRTALIEARPNDLPKLPGGAVASASRVGIVDYEPNRILIETDAPTATILVTSEIFYPGWEARVDGARTPILLTDYLLRGISLPAGQHRVEMRYTAPAARSGAIISVVTLLLLGTLAFFARSRRKFRTAAEEVD